MKTLLLKPKLSAQHTKIKLCLILIIFKYNFRNETFTSRTFYKLIDKIIMVINNNLNELLH